MTQHGFILDAPRPPRDSSGWTIPLICVGMAIVAACVLIPAASENRALAAQTRQLQADLDNVRSQISVNDAFLKSVADDPTLLERLAQRQMKMVREGTSVLALHDPGRKPNPATPSPFLLLSIPPPQQPLAAADPGPLDQLIASPHTRLLGIGAALLCIAAGLVLGASASKE